MRITLAGLLTVLLTLSTALTGCAPIGKKGPSLPTIPGAGVLLSPIRADAAGVDPVAGFHLASATPLSLSQVQQLLTVSPAVELRYEQADKDGKLFAIQPARALDADRVYRFKLAAGEGVEREYQWSFQTRADFRVLGTLPRHQATHVPVDTGIEITFSHEEFADPGALFTISPKVDGRFDRHKKTLVFVPKQKLQPGTVYTVTMKPGLALQDSEMKLEQEIRFAFETESVQEANQRNQGWLHTPTDLLQFPDGAAPYLPVEYYSNDRGREMANVAVTLYRYKDATQFIDALKRAGQVPWWASYSQSQYKEETKGLTRVSAFETKLQQLPGHYQTHLIFPDGLKQGYYLAELKVANQIRQVRIQISDLTAHLTVAENQSLLWLNDLATKAPVAGADVTHPGGKLKTAADGTARFDTPNSFGGSDSEGLYLTLKAGAKEAVVAVQPGSYFFYDMPYARGGMIWPPWPMQTGALDYWKYLYTDRPLYKPQDTVQLFGVLKPREASAKEPKSVTASIIRREYRGWDEQPIALVKQQLAVVDNTYTGALTLPNLKPGSYELQIQMDGEYVQSRWFEVQAYTKPAYTVTVTPERKAIFQEESVDFTVKATFFEGTPVPGLTFNYSLGWADQHQQAQVTTGADGTATIRFTPGTSDPLKDRDYFSLGPIQAYLNLWASLPEAGEISSSAWVQVFSRDITFQPKVEIDEDGKAVIEVQAHHVSLEQMNAGGDSWEFKGAPLAGARVEAVLTEVSWVKVPSGEYYDFIEKKVVPTYDYRQERREAGRFSATTDAEGKMLHKLSIDAEKSYEVRLTMLDGKGRAVNTTYYFSGRYWTVHKGGMPEHRWFNLAPVDQKDGWNVGETVELQLRENDAPAADRTRGFLFFEARMGLKAHAVQDSGTFRISLKEADLPNTNVRAVYFDGRRYWEAGEASVRFDPLHRELKVELIPDKAVYRPGEMVGVTAKVTDKEGRPVKAQLNLNLVDEALYALRDQSADILGSLYSDHVPSGILRSHTVFLGDYAGVARAEGAADKMAAPPGAVGSAAPQGAADSGQATHVRTEFKDAAYFTTIATDASGQGRASFKLPDNLTTWRLTYQAFAPGIMGGATGTQPVTVKIPFFVDMVIASSYLTGDKPVMTVRSYGTDLAEGQSVSYAITITAPDGSRTERQVTGKAFSPVLIPLEQLQTGTYKVQVHGAAGSLTDAMEQQVTVVETYLKAPKVTFQLLANGTKVQGSASGLTQVIFTDYHRGRYLHLLESLSWAGGNRFEQRMARFIAVDLLQAHFDRDQFWKDTSWDPLSYQTPDGSVAILPYSDGDLYLSALVADLAPDLVDRGMLASYFEQVLDDPKLDRERATIALYGLAALDRPVLRQISSLMQTKGLSAAEQLNLALAAAALGDLEGARPLFRALWKQHGEQLGENARIKLGRDQDEILASTAQAAVLAARLGEPEAFALLGYLLENPTKEILLSLELLLVAREVLPGLAQQPVGFTAVVGGEERKVALAPGETAYWYLTPQQIATMQIRGVEGKVAMTTVYEAPLSSADIRQEPGFSLSRSYSVVGRPGTTEWKPGDLIRISLTYSFPKTAPGGGYEVTDYLPAGLKLIERPWQHGVEWRSSVGRSDPAWPMAVEGQRISFWAWDGSHELVYYARVVTPGEYTAEQPALQHMRSGVIYKLGERERVRIGE